MSLVGADPRLWLGVVDTAIGPSDGGVGFWTTKLGGLPVGANIRIHKLPNKLQAHYKLNIRRRTTFRVLPSPALRAGLVIYLQR